MTLTLTTFGRCCATFRECDVEIIIMVLTFFFGLGILIGIFDK